MAPHCFGFLSSFISTPYRFENIIGKLTWFSHYDNSHAKFWSTSCVTVILVQIALLLSFFFVNLLLVDISSSLRFIDEFVYL